MDIRSRVGAWIESGPVQRFIIALIVINAVTLGLETSPTVMAAYGEGLNILEHANVGRHDQATDAETAPLDAAPYYRYDLDLMRTDPDAAQGPPTIPAGGLIEKLRTAFQELQSGVAGGMDAGQYADVVRLCEEADAELAKHPRVQAWSRDARARIAASSARHRKSTSMPPNRAILDPYPLLSSRTSSIFSPIFNRPAM